MKKYVKPELFYEHYELNQHIADCAFQAEFNSKDACSASYYPGDPNWGLDGKYLFTENPCNVEQSVVQDYCYHSGAGGANIFAS